MTINRAIKALAATICISISSIPLVASSSDDMANGVNGYQVKSIFTVGQDVGGYYPPGILDGLGAFIYDASTVRVLANHELLNFRGYEYTVPTNTINLKGARISFFDIDKETKEIINAGPAYETIYDVDGNVAVDTSFLANQSASFQGFSRFCSASLFEAEQFGNGRGLSHRIFMTGEEDGGNFNPIGGAEWALDPSTQSIWHLPDLGRGAWENVTILDTNNQNYVAVLLADDSSPFDADGDGDDEAAPLYLYVGEKDPTGDFPAQNGLRGGKLYVFVANNGDKSPADFNTRGALIGKWVEIDNSRMPALASNDGSSGYDDFGYPTQRTLWTRAEALGAFGFSRPEDVATNPRDGQEAVLASTGVDTFVGGVDTFGTIYRIKTNFNNLNNLRARLRIIYDGDADPLRKLRSPDNLDWADDGYIYIQEDEAEEKSLEGESLFGDGSVNGNEAGIVKMNRRGRHLVRVANVDRTVLFDPSITPPDGLKSGPAIDRDAGEAGEWESSGILDVSTLFDEDPGQLFIFDVQAHGIEDQSDCGDGIEGYETCNPESRINDQDLVEGGQLLLLCAPESTEHCIEE